MIKELRSSFLIPAAFVIVLVLVEVGKYVFDVDLVQFGVFPRKFSGLVGVFTYPFIHSGWEHLTNNSAALLVLGTMLYYFYRPIATKTLLWVYLMSGFWLWIGGRANFHIGASGIVYALFGFLFFSGLLRKHLKLMALSLLVVFLYGSLVWGVLPIDHHISYEGHLFGLIAGAVVAVAYRKQGPQKPKYSWDFVEEEEVPDWYPDPERIRREQAEKQLQEQQQKSEPRKINIRYVIKKDDKKEDRN
jgi:membrane associated rhomboid family serine protease